MCVGVGVAAGVGVDVGVEIEVAVASGLGVASSPSQAAARRAAPKARRKGQRKNITWRVMHMTWRIIAKPVCHRKGGLGEIRACSSPRRGPYPGAADRFHGGLHGATFQIWPIDKFNLRLQNRRVEPN